MPELAGCTCLLCRSPIATKFDGTFCPDCGGPYHYDCFGKRPGGVEHPCGYCRGDRNDAQALRTTVERGNGSQPVPEGKPIDWKEAALTGLRFARGAKIVFTGIAIIGVGLLLTFGGGGAPVYPPPPFNPADHAVGILTVIAGAAVCFLGVLLMRGRK